MLEWVRALLDQRRAAGLASGSHLGVTVEVAGSSKVLAKLWLSDTESYWSERTSRKGDLVGAEQKRKWKACTKKNTKKTKQNKSKQN